MLLDGRSKVAEWAAGPSLGEPLLRAVYRPALPKTAIAYIDQKKAKGVDGTVDLFLTHVKSLSYPDPGDPTKVVTVKLEKADLEKLPWPAFDWLESVVLGYIAGRFAEEGN